MKVIPVCRAYCAVSEVTFAQSLEFYAFDVHASKLSTGGVSLGSFRLEAGGFVPFSEKYKNFTEKLLRLLDGWGRIRPRLARGVRVGVYPPFQNFYPARLVLNDVLHPLICWRCAIVLRSCCVKPGYMRSLPSSIRGLCSMVLGSGVISTVLRCPMAESSLIASVPMGLSGSLESMVLSP